MVGLFLRWREMNARLLADLFLQSPHAPQWEGIAYCLLFADLWFPVSCLGFALSLR